VRPFTDADGHYFLVPGEAAVIEDGSAHTEELALPKSAKSGNLSLNKVVIRWMSA
jgi:hypothetical protein